MDDDARGGDPACFLNEVCEECGAVIAEGHRQGCSAAEPQKDPSDQG